MALLVMLDGSIVERNDLPDPETTGADRTHFRRCPPALAYLCAWPAVGGFPAVRCFIWAIEGAPKAAVERAGRRGLMAALRTAALAAERGL